MHEDPKVVQEPSVFCATDARLVLDVCTQLGPADECVDTGDVCIALCGGASSCKTVGGRHIVSCVRRVADAGFRVQGT